MVGWFTKADAFLLGRKTYDIFVSYWPKVTDPADPIASRLNALPKYVVSRGQPPLDWHNSHLVTGDVPAEIASLKQLPGDELQVHGSGNLVHTLDPARPGRRVPAARLPGPARHRQAALPRRRYRRGAAPDRQQADGQAACRS